MNRIKHLLSLILLTGLVFTSCDNNDYELGDMLDKSDIDFEVIQDYSIDPGGNTVILINNTPKTTSIWDFGTGRSNRAIDTVRYAFQGEYQIKFSAVTAGGVVELDPVTISVTEDNLNYVDDPLWDALTGGVGNSKTWLLDLNAEGVSKYFVGPQYFYGTDMGWLEGGDGGCYGDDCWNWNPDWPGNSWLMPAADYGEMTFSLQGGPFVTTNHLTIPGRGEESGTFFLDADAKTLTMTDASILHPQGIESCVDSWANMKIMSLTEDHMQLAVLRKGSCDGAALLVYNFISKEYSDNWVPEETIPEPDEGFDPTFAPGELLEMLTGGVGSGRIWALDGAGNPVDWINADGNGWTTDATSSYNWGWNDDWAAVAADSWIRFDQFGGSLNYTRSQGGVETTGTFSINEATNEIDLGTETLIQEPNSWMNPTTNTITVVKAFNDDFAAKGIWFGTSYDESKGEWFVFHYVIPQ